MIYPVLFFSWTYHFFPCDYSSFHDISLLTTLAFVIASFHLIPWTSITHLFYSYILLHDSFAFHCIPFVSSLFQNFPSLRYINPWLAMYLPKLDLLCTLVHSHTNLVPLFLHLSLTLWKAFAGALNWWLVLRKPWPMTRNSLGRIFEPLTLT